MVDGEVIGLLAFLFAVNFFVSLGLALVADKMGYRFIRMLLIGVFLSHVLVLIALLFLPDRSKTQRCPNCGLWQPRALAVCTACSATLGPIAEPPADADEQR